MSKPKFAIVASDYRPDVVAQLRAGAVAVLDAANVKHETVQVSGSLEIPAAVELLRGRFDGFVVLGCLMKGATIHDEVIAYTIFPAIDSMAREHHLPIGNGVLTVATEEQAAERADPKRQDRGGEAAKAAVRMWEIREGKFR